MIVHRITVVVAATVVGSKDYYVVPKPVHVAITSCFAKEQSSISKFLLTYNVVTRHGYFTLVA
jgi:hypothetical protein